MQNFDFITQKAIKAATQTAIEQQCETFNAAQLVLSILDTHPDLANLLILENTDLPNLRAWLQQYAKPENRVFQKVKTARPDKSVMKIYAEADRLAWRLQFEEVNALVLFAAIFQPEVLFTQQQLEALLPFSHDMVLQIASNQIEAKKHTQLLPHFSQSQIKSRIVGVNQSHPDNLKCALKNQCETFSGAIGREKEIRVLSELLARVRKKSVLLVGENGVGKSALLNEWHTQQATQNSLILSAADLMSGVFQKNELETKLNQITENLKTQANPILIIEDLQRLFSGKNELPDALAIWLDKNASQGEMAILATCTQACFAKNIEKNENFANVFDVLRLDEPSETLAAEILAAHLPNLCQIHKVQAAAALAPEIVRLAKRYFPEKALPESALDLLDRSLATAFLNKKTEIESDDLRETIARQLGIPAGKVGADESQKILNLEENLRQKVIGQNAALALVSQKIRVNRAGLQEKNRTAGAFFFTGPTGTGKTELARTLAEQLFDDGRAFLRLDMSEFMEKHAVATLTGAPPGYVGYEEGGKLVNFIRQKPHAVILFDEIEKAHDDVFNIFLQILEPAKLSDRQGRVGDFSNAIVIFTSNLGAAEITDFFEKKQTPPDRETLENILKSRFKPEFINRLDDIVPFAPLDRDTVRQICQIHISRLEQLLKTEKNLHLKISPAAIEVLCEAGYSPEFGARPLRRSIDRLLREPLAMRLLRGEYKSGDCIEIGDLANF